MPNTLEKSTEKVQSTCRKSEEKKIPENTQQANAVRLKFKNKLDEPITNSLMQRFECHWDRDEKAYFCPIKKTIEINAFLENEVGGKNFNTENIYNHQISLSPNQKKSKKVEYVQGKKTQEGVNQLIEINNLINDYNKRWDENITKKDFEDESFKDIKHQTNDPKKLEHLEIIKKEHLKFVEIHKEERKLNNIKNALSNPEKNTSEGSIRDGDFLIEKSGLYYFPKLAETEEEPKKEWISSPIWPEAYLRDKENQGHTLLVKIYDGEKYHTVPIPRKIIAKWTELSEILLDLGQNVPTSPKNQKHIQNFLMQARPSNVMRCVNKAGWNGSQYTFPDGETIGKNEEKSESVYLTSKEVPKGFKQKKEHADWLKNVWSLCANNSRLIFSVGVALASPCLYLVDEDSGGFNFLGKSSIGKSRCLGVAISVFGSPDFKRSWKNTSNGFEALCALHNDLLLPIDEGGQADPKEMGENIYMFSQGMGKGRMYKDTSARDSKDWRAMMLSTAELSLSNLMREGKRKPKPGQLVRIADIPGAVKYGCFEDLHGYENGVDGEEFAKRLKQVCNQYYGTCGKEFLQKLIDYGIENSKEFLRNSSDDFCADVARNFDGQVKRVANRFGLVFAALALAIKLKVLNDSITSEMAKSAIAKCFKDWLANRGTTGSKENFNLVQHIESLLLENSDGKFVDISDYKKDDKIRNTLWGCRDGSTFYIFCPAFTEHFCKDIELEEAKNILINAEILDQKIAGHLKKFNGVATRFYALNLDAINKMQSIDNK